MRQKKSWIKFRHKVATFFIRPFLKLYISRKYGADIVPFENQGGRQYLVLMNHQTGFDQFFIGVSFKGPVYYIASEDIFSMGWVSKLISYLVAPIPIKKQTTDIQAVKTCLRVAKEGGTIALAPEGNRTYSGKTEYIKPGIISLIKKLKLPIAIYRIEGGYGVHPRWSDVVRKGKMKAYVGKVIEHDDYKQLSNDELYELICQELYVDETLIEGNFYHKQSAEYLERALYVCPKCGFSYFESHDDIVECKKCGLKVKYLPDKRLKGVDCEVKFEFFNDWYDYQSDYVNNTDITKYNGVDIFEDIADIYEVIVYKKKEKLHTGVKIYLRGDSIIVGDIYTFHFENTSAVTVLGKNKLNIYAENKVYQIKGNKRFNALKYVNIFNRYKNISEGNYNGKFLGL